MSKRIAKAFQDGQFVSPRFTVDAANWLKDFMTDRLAPIPAGWLSREYFTEIIGAIQCELDELKPE